MGGSDSQPSEPENTQSSSGRGMWWFLFLAGILLINFFHLRPYWVSHDAQAWTRVPCIITSSVVGDHASDSSRHRTSYRSVDISYHYTVAGVKHTGSRYDFTFAEQGSDEWMKSAVAQYHRDMETTCLVNPDDPLDVVLKAEVGYQGWGVADLVAAIFIGFGARAIFFRRRLQEG